MHVESTKPLTTKSCPNGLIDSPPTYSKQTLQRYSVSLPYFLQVGSSFSVTISSKVCGVFSIGVDILLFYH